ncbi:hypothetical protein FJT64_000466 [Amphibalanus amphitrite]|uniref:Uncharacterized protein n=1 Tax=Amphibalanus amphitrite TaxID=1232801 RepID=A0A6A4W7U8_AMPAM|nr:hypothetical protein FJT64_000466 [Amphibalanus amphitrite]
MAPVVLDLKEFAQPEELQDEELRRSPDLLQLYSPPKPSLTGPRETVPLKTLRVKLVKLESRPDFKKPTLAKGGNLTGSAKAKRRAPAAKRAVIPKLPEKPLTDPKKVAALRRTLLLPKTTQRTVRCLPRFPYWRHWSEIP